MSPLLTMLRALKGIGLLSRPECLAGWGSDLLYKKLHGGDRMITPAETQDHQLWRRQRRRFLIAPC
jgi:hypothetical protein